MLVLNWLSGESLAARPEWSSFSFLSKKKKAGTEGGNSCPNYINYF